MHVRFKQLRPEAKLPAYQTKHSAGFDLCAISSGTLNAGDTKIIGTGLAMAMAENMTALVCSRSGLAAKHSVFVLNAPGVIDADYRGEVGVILHNAGRDKWHFKAGERIAQMLIMPVYRPYIRLVSELDETERGEGGFGSTGKGGE